MAPPTVSVELVAPTSAVAAADGSGAASHGGAGCFDASVCEVERTEVMHHMFELDGCEGFRAGGFEELAEKPTLQPCEGLAAAVCSVINGDRGCSASRFVVGHLVPLGSIGLIDHNGRIEAVPEGHRYILGLHRASWVNSFSMACDRPVKQGSVTMVRVPRGQVGLASRSGNAILLEAGLHVHNDNLFQFEQLCDLNRNHLHHGPLHVVRVKRGWYGKAWIVGPSGGLEPKLLREGCYTVDSNMFSLEGFCSTADEYVCHGTLHIMQVPKGHVAKVFRDNLPKLLGEGTHFIDSANFKYKGLASLGDLVIQHGTITMVRICEGQVGLAWQDNQPLFMQQPGVFSFNSPTFIFERHACFGEKLIELGTKKIVTVYSGEVGLSFDNGELKVLYPGRHEIVKASHIIKRFISTQQKSVRLTTSQAGGQGDGQWLICETKDLVKVGLRADVFYAIEDPDKAVRRIDADEIENLVLETSLATITNIVRSTTLNDIAQSKMPSAVSTVEHEKNSQKAQALGQATAPLFFDRAHDEFLSKLHDDFRSRYGLEITNIRIEAFKIMDEELANSISKQALVTAQTENQLANLAGQTEIATKEQERLSSVRQITANAEAVALRTTTDAENQAQVSAAEARAKAGQVQVETTAHAEAAATIARAKAEAEAIRMVGQAQADALEARAQAEAKRASLLAETPLGSQLSLLEIYADMAVKSNAGVEKVIYSDLKGDGLGLLALPSLANLGRDMSLLSGFDGLAGSDQGSKLAAQK